MGTRTPATEQQVFWDEGPVDTRVSSVQAPSSVPGAGGLGKKGRELPGEMGPCGPCTVLHLLCHKP